ncbi:hypothetical protein CMU26_05765 [Elizabethkingia anophelis]|nr:hypothetical protein [Elizabethkingia anophelis]
MTNIDRKDYPRIEEILTNAFRENKSVNYILKKEGENLLISKLISYSIFKGYSFGDIWLNETKTACVICIDPKKERITLESLKKDFWLITSVIGIKNLLKVLKKESITKKHLPYDIDFVHLWYIGVIPEEQGQGIGSKLLLDVIKYYKEKKEAICLETSTLKNLPFYENLGFHRYHTENFGFDFYFLIKHL